MLNLFSEKYSHKITREYAEKKILKDDEIYQNIDNKKIIDNFINFYNKLKIKGSNGDIIRLKEDRNHLSDFVLDENNEIGKTYINIYKTFINKQNKEIEKLLDIKIKEGILDSDCSKRINIQQIKEDEIFTLNTPKKFSFINLLFNSSYRKIIDNNNYEFYNQYEIDFDYIEETMTDLLLKNKKLLNEDIIEFNYNNEIFSNEVNDLITSFNNYYKSKTISLDDKTIIYNFVFDYKNNKILYKNIINDFITLLNYLNDLKKQGKEGNDFDISETKIYEVAYKSKYYFSEKFLSIFKDKNKLTVNKTSEIFGYYLKLIYKDIKDEIKNFQKELVYKKLKDKKYKLEEYYKKQSLISKEDFSSAIRLFISLILFREEDKENKIKHNCKNIVNYLRAKDFWDKNVYNNDKFNEYLNELKLINIQINEILYLVEIKEEDISDIQDYIESNKKAILFEDTNLEEEESSSYYSEFVQKENESENESEEY